MSDLELVLSITREREDYHEPFHEYAEAELKGRGISLSDFLNGAALAAGLDDPEVGTIDQVANHFTPDIASWELFVVTNCLDETIAVQKEVDGWSIHEYEDGAYTCSYFVPEAAEEVRRFLELAPPLEVDVFNLDEWMALEQSKSPVYIRRLISELNEADVSSTVQPPVMLGDPDGPYTLRVPGNRLKAGQDALVRVAEGILGLHRRAETLAEGEDRKSELELYDLLVELEPGNYIVWYNRGVVRLEMDRKDDAANDFLEAATLLMVGGGDVRSLIPKRSAGGLLGSVMGTGKSEAPRIPDALPDVELRLIEILTEHPARLDIIECLAGITRSADRWDDSAGYCKRILEIDPDNEMAKAVLASLPMEEE